MSRTTSNTVEYFPHFCKLGSKTVFILKSRFGNDGYAFWFQLLEVLCQSENHYYDCRSPELWQYLISICGSNEITATEILALLSSLGNIDTELWGSKIIWCPALVENLKEVYRKRGRGIPSKPIIGNNNQITGDKKGITVAEMPHSRVEDSREKESRVEDRIEVDLSSSSPSFQENNVLESYSKNIGKLTPLIEEELHKACERYSAAWVFEAIKETGKKNPDRHNLNYIGKVLENCLEEGHAPGNSRSKEGKNKGPPGFDNDKYFKGPYGHLVNR